MNLTVVQLHRKIDLTAYQRMLVPVSVFMNSTLSGPADAYRLFNPQLFKELMNL